MAGIPLDPQLCLFADEPGVPLPTSQGTVVEWCRKCRQMFDIADLRRGEDDKLCCAGCYDAVSNGENQ